MSIWIPPAFKQEGVSTPSYTLRTDFCAEYDGWEIKGFTVHDNSIQAEGTDGTIAEFPTEVLGDIDSYFVW